jgi:hypothetical protein
MAATVAYSSFYPHTTLKNDPDVEQLFSIAVALLGSD